MRMLQAAQVGFHLGYCAVCALLEDTDMATAHAGDIAVG